MQVVTSELVKNKKVLLRMDLDVPIENGHIVDASRLEAGLPTLELCLEHADSVVVMGHLGRPGGKVVPTLSVAPIHEWLEEKFGPDFLESGKLCLMENLRFEKGEEDCDPDFARELASYGNFYINEAFASYHKAASTTVLPKLLPHAAGLQFVREVRVLGEVREKPKKPFVAIIGGAKVEDKLPVVLAMAEVADYVLVGGKIAREFNDIDAGPAARQPHAFPTSLTSEGPPHGAPRLASPATIPPNVLVARLNKDGTDITRETIDSWKNIIMGAKMIVWNGPVGWIEDPNLKSQISNLKSEEMGSAKGTYDLAQMIIQTGAESIIGGGDTVGFLGKLGLLGKFGFVSTGGGACLKFLETGTLSSIEALN